MRRKGSLNRIRFIFRTHARSTRVKRNFLQRRVVGSNVFYPLIVFFHIWNEIPKWTRNGDRYKLIFERIDDLWNYKEYKYAKKKKKREINLYLCMDFLSLPVSIKMQIETGYIEYTSYVTLRTFLSWIEYNKTSESFNYLKRHISDGRIFRYIKFINWKERIVYCYIVNIWKLYTNYDEG